MTDTNLHNLIKAIKRGDVDSIHSLIESGTDIDAHNEQGLTPLCIAAMNSNTQVLEALIDAGVDVNKPSLHGFAPLSCAVRAKRKKASALLREAGAKHEESNIVTEHMKKLYPGIDLDLYGGDT